jgi:hypothetical protein
MDVPARKDALLVYRTLSAVQATSLLIKKGQKSCLKDGFSEDIFIFRCRKINLFYERVLGT